MVGLLLPIGEVKGDKEDVVYFLGDLQRTAHVSTENQCHVGVWLYGDFPHSPTVSVRLLLSKILRSAL